MNQMNKRVMFNTILCHTLWKMTVFIIIMIDVTDCTKTISQSYENKVDELCLTFIWMDIWNTPVLFFNQIPAPLVSMWMKNTLCFTFFLIHTGYCLPFEMLETMNVIYLTGRCKNAQDLTSKVRRLR